MSVSREQRFTSRNPCPVCGGYDQLLHGRGVRCYGFLGSDGMYAHCSREEYANGLDVEPESETFAHKLGGLCRCGRIHREQDEPIPIRKEQPRQRRIADVYGYFTADNEPFLEAVRYADPKGFSQRRSDGKGGYIWNTQGLGPLPPYHLPELLAAPANAIVAFAEGEKDVHTLERLGFVATTTAMGAGKSHFTDLSPLSGHPIVVLPDNDDAGRSHAHKVATQLVDLGCKVKVVTIPDLPEKGDVTDWVAAGGTRADLVRLIKQAERFDASEAPPPPQDGPERKGPRPIEVPPFPIEAFPPWCATTSKKAPDPSDARST